MNDEEKRLLDETLNRILLSIDILTEAVLADRIRIERLETVVIQIAKIQGGGKDVIHPN